MGSFLLTLLSFGLCLSLGITAQIVTLSKPILWAKPRSMVAWGTDVILWCQGPPGVDMYRLERLDSPNDYKDQPGLPGTEARARFPLGSALASVAGRYRCSYRNGSRWSQPSNQLELIVTVTASHNGTYQCYGFDSHFPHLWTAPSEPLELRVKGIPQPPSPRESNTPTGAPTSPHIFPDKVDIPIGLTSQDYTVSNLVRLVLAGLTVAALGVLLAEAWRAKFHMLSGSPSQAQGPTAPQVKGLPL
ncbi:platelet glycoprotein VI-like isoform X3 [Phascolarctos cinereus]|uniref:Leukocyte immunoglobulin-like receptor subfamily A member 4 isoform X3 n=1 Tax=Phascolarctos cinereus TaxID=38626 RepID=A0A6P5LRM8_PHACI|nr:leukocyte immunoglobulin-like receptor subfamily A member 4 isoform X3 [Phascolarctos cinereus]